MPVESTELDPLIDRFKQLRDADQGAVLAQLSAEEREQVLAAMTDRELTRRSEQAAAGEAGRRYAAYSPWLAKLVRSAEGEADESMTTTAAKALAEAHRVLATETTDSATGPLGQVRTWFARLFAPPKGAAR
jgi:hypothetical protein